MLMLAPASRLAYALPYFLVFVHYRLLVKSGTKSQRARHINYYKRVWEVVGYCVETKFFVFLYVQSSSQLQNAGRAFSQL